MASDDSTLSSEVKSGLRWSFLNTAVGRATTFASGIVLARILVPQDFGVFAVALVVVQLLLSLNDIGVSACVVRWEGSVEEIRGTGTVLAMAVSIVLFAAMFAAAPAFSAAMHAPRATPLVRAMCVTVLIDGFFAVPSAMLTRSLRQDRRALTDFTVFATATGLTLGLAVAGAGAWSLVWGRLAGNLVGGLAIVAVTRTGPRIGWRPDVARHMLAFGLPLTGAALLQFATLNVDNIIVGRYLGPAVLGLYVLAFNLSGWPVNVLSDTIRRVSVVAFSRLRSDPEAARSGMIGSSALVIAVALPVCGLLAVLAAPLIDLLYGPRWHAAAQALRFLAVLGGVRVFVELVSDYLLALGHPRAIFAIQGLWALALVPALTIGARAGGLAGVGLGHMLVATVLVLPAALVATGRTGVRLRRIATQSLWPFGAAGAALAAAALLHGRVPGRLVQLLLGGGVGVGVYVLLLLPRRSQLLDLLGRKTSTTREAAPA